jgi:PAS domain S-box-containing protein
MMWIENVDCRALRTFLRHCGVPVLVSNLDGAILWANNEFCDWSGYTVTELQTMGWKKLSVQDESLEADFIEANKLDEYQLSYTIQKRYVPKNSQPAWGTLSVLRYPAIGPIEYCICIWIPLKNGTQAAFNMAMTELGKLTLQIESCRHEVAKLTVESEENKFLGSAIILAKKYPKTTWALFVLVLSIFGFNNLLQIATGLNLVPKPTVMVDQVESKDHRK